MTSNEMLEFDEVAETISRYNAIVDAVEWKRVDGKIMYYITIKIAGQEVIAINVGEKNFENLKNKIS